MANEEKEKPVGRTWFQRRWRPLYASLMASAAAHFLDVTAAVVVFWVMWWVFERYAPPEEVTDAPE